MKKFIWVAVLLILAGCSGKPGTSEIKDQFVEQIEILGLGKAIKIDNFEKTDGASKNGNTYIAYVKYDLVFKKSLKQIARLLEKETQDTPLRAMQANVLIMGLQMRYGNFKAGYRVAKQDKVVMVKTEKGWRMEDDLNILH